MGIRTLPTTNDPDMWSRWARRRRITGLIFLGVAAVTLTTATFLFLIGLGPFAATPAVLTIPIAATAVSEFIGAHRDERRSHGDDR